MTESQIILKCFKPGKLAFTESNDAIQQSVGMDVGRPREKFPPASQTVSLAGRIYRIYRKSSVKTCDC